MRYSNDGVSPSNIEYVYISLNDMIYDEPMR